MHTPHALNPWFRLFRLPNLLSVPGDPLAGFLIAAAGHVDRAMFLPMLAVMAASVCLYMFGLALNDIVDIETDRIERPDRPLPSGQITVAQAKAAAIAAALSGLNLAWVAGLTALCVAGVLAFTILAYNRFKRLSVLGVCAMGLCRGLSALLGVAAVRPEWFAECPGRLAIPVGLAVAVVFAYVVAVSVIAKDETADEKPMGFARWMPFVVLLVGLPCVLMTMGQTEGVMPVVAVFLMCMALMWAWVLGGMMYRVQPVPDTVAGHIRNLLRVQACLCAAAGSAGLFPALFLMALSFVFPRLARRFYSS